MRNRYYHPLLGVWVTRDRRGADGANLYEYVRTSPLRHTDPAGREAWSGGGWNPGNWYRGLMTGDFSAPDDIYRGGLDAAGGSLVGGSLGNAHAILKTLDTLDPTGLAGGVDATLERLEGPELQANIGANVNPNLANIQQGAEKIAAGLDAVRAVRDFRKKGIRKALGCTSGPKTPSAGGGASLEKAAAQMSADDLRRIQNAANRIDTQIHLVGSRSGGIKHPRTDSDWDYVNEANSKTRHGAAKSLPGRKSNLQGEPWNQDIFKGPLDQTKPHITFYPQE